MKTLLILSSLLFSSASFARSPIEKEWLVCQTKNGRGFITSACADASRVRGARDEAWVQEHATAWTPGLIKIELGCRYTFARPTACNVVRL